MTVELWALAGVLLLSGALCVWAWATGRPGQISGLHRIDGETRPLEWNWIDDDWEVRSRREGHGAGRKRWHDENPWPDDGPHGWGGTHD
jgi:hypothetical protein